MGSVTGEQKTRLAAAAVEDEDAKASDIVGDWRKMGCEAGLEVIFATMC